MRSKTKPEIDLSEKERAIDAIVSSLPPVEPVERRAAPGEAITVTTPQQVQRIVWLKFCGFSTSRIARDLGLGNTVVSRYMRSQAFERAYESERGAMLARVDDTLSERLQELALEALALKVRLMRNPKTNRFLRNKIAGEILEMALARGGGGRAKRPSDLLKAMYEEARRVVAPDGSIVTKTLRVEGDATADLLARTRDDEGGGGGSPGPDGGTGGVGGETGSGEGTGTVGGSGDHTGNGSGSVRSLPEPTG